MPFPFQKTGALGGGVPNQISTFTPKNSEGLRFPNNQVAFNLPRFQLPGTSINFGQGMSAGGGPNAMMRFSVTRTASSDPIANIINDISNPLGGTNISVGGGQPAPAPQQQAPGFSSFGPGLRSSMTRVDPRRDQFGTRALAEGISTNRAAQFRDFGRPSAVNRQVHDQLMQAQPAPFSLRHRMLAGQNALPPQPAFVFI